MNQVGSLKVVQFIVGIGRKLMPFVENVVTERQSVPAVPRERVPPFDFCGPITNRDLKDTSRGNGELSGSALPQQDLLEVPVINVVLRLQAVPQRQ
jgi:hypothetical protein